MPRALLLLILLLVLAIPAAMVMRPAPAAPRKAPVNHVPVPAPAPSVPPSSPPPAPPAPRSPDATQQQDASPRPSAASSRRLQWRTGQAIRWVDGRPVQPATAPVIRRGRTMVPAPELAEALGARLQYNSTTRQTSFKLGGRGVVLHAEVRSGVAWVPLRRVAEGLGGTVTWGGRLGLVTVTLRMQP